MRPSALSPDGITLLVNTDNARAIRFYERNGFVHAGEDVNPTSGRPVLKMAWKRIRHCRCGSVRTNVANSSSSTRMRYARSQGTQTSHTPSNCSRASRA